VSELTFQAVLVGRVLLARARGALTATSLAEVLRQVAAARAQVGKPLLYWPVLDPGAEVPPPEVRVLLSDATEALLRSCESMTLIIPGHGVKVSLLRTFMRGMVRLGGHAARVRIVDSLAAAVSAAAGEASIDLAELRSAAEAAGIDVEGVDASRSGPMQTR